jgi:hypothetical protein
VRAFFVAFLSDGSRLGSGYRVVAHKLVSYATPCKMGVEEVIVGACRHVPSRG